MIAANVCPTNETMNRCQAGHFGIVLSFFRLLVHNAYRAWTHLEQLIVALQLVIAAD